MYIDGSAYEISVGAGITFGSAGVSTFSGTADVHLTDNVYLKVGDSNDFSLYHDGSGSYLQANSGGTGSLYLDANGDRGIYIRSGDGSSSVHQAVSCVSNAEVQIYYDNSKKFETTNDGVSITGIATCSHGLNVDGLLSEKFNTLAGKMSDNPNIDLQDGMIWYFTTTETTTATPNIRFSSSKSLNNMMKDGDVVSVTIITTAAAAGYAANWEIDGTGITEEWVGGSAPSSGGANGYDIYSLTILKTGSAAYKVFINVSNAT